MNNIRRANLNDLDSLAVLFDGYRVFYGKTADVNAAKNFLKERLTLNDSTIFLCEENGQYKGFTQLYPLFSSVRMKKLWLLNDLFVDEKFRGQGISIELINAAKLLAKESGACGLYLETAKDNHLANKLYKEVGFRQNTDHNFYDWSVDQ